MVHEYIWKGNEDFFEIFRVMDSSEDGDGGTTLLRRVYKMLAPANSAPEGEKPNHVYVVIKPGHSQDPSVPTHVFPAHYSKDPEGMSPGQVKDKLASILDNELKAQYQRASRSATKSITRRPASSEEAA